MDCECQELGGKSQCEGFTFIHVEIAVWRVYIYTLAHLHVEIASPVTKNKQHKDTQNLCELARGKVKTIGIADAGDAVLLRQHRTFNHRGSPVGADNNTDEKIGFEIAVGTIYVEQVCECDMIECGMQSHLDY